MIESDLAQRHILERFLKELEKTFFKKFSRINVLKRSGKTFSKFGNEPA